MKQPTTLSKRAIAVLRMANDADEELVADGIHCYVGDEPISLRTINALLVCLAISDVSDQTGGMTRFAINGTGKAILRRPELAAEVTLAILLGRKVTVIEDHLVDI